MSSDMPVTFVLMEDNPGHARLFEKSLQRAGIINPLITLSDGLEAVEYLLSLSDKTETTDGDALVLLLDMSLPGLDGLQVLERVKSDGRIAHIPVIMLSSIDAPENHEDYYALGVHCILTKPAGYEELFMTLQKLGLMQLIVKPSSPRS